MSLAAAPPLVSVVMANFNGERYLAAAIRSALAQTVADFEVLLVDDGSTDESLGIAQALAAGDRRVVVLPPAPNGGPGAARNRGLDAARGAWIAVQDSDDLMHPERLARLLAAAERDGDDIVADDMLAFFEDGSPPRPTLRGRLRLPIQVDLPLYVRANALFGRLPPLGYLKPLFRAALLRRSGARYDPLLRIGEDYDLVARLLAQGARMRIHPDLTYFYRRHDRSTSHRLRRSDLLAMVAADDRLHGIIAAPDASVEAAFRVRRASVQRALGFDAIVGALKVRDFGTVLRTAVAEPGAVALLRLPVLARLRRLLATRVGAPAAAATGLRVDIVSRNRVVGSSSGSSAYLLGLCRALAEAGHELHLTWPSASMLGRTPVLRLQPEMALFRSIAMHGAWRVGPWLVARDPRLWWAAAIGIGDRLAGKLGGSLGGLVRKAPYSVAVPWRPEDLLYVADRIRGRADAVIADYAFLTPAFPYALSPDARRAVVMHDLFSSRPASFAGAGAADSVTQIDEASELRLLGAADAVIAIQAAEGAFIAERLPGVQVIVAPMAIEPVAAPQPGVGATLLFVGSSAAPNVAGLRWFLDEVLPLVRARIPQVVLRVVGAVGGAVGAVPAPLAGVVQLLGQVPELAPYYRDAAVVISPLRAGSGLKIKLIEALGHGKAVVATAVTLQGVEAACAPAVRATDSAADFAAEVAALLEDDTLRAARAAASLQVAREHFSAAACYAGLLGWLRGPFAPHGPIP